jgi:hypothetical protein
VENSYRNYDWKNKSIVELLGTGNKILWWCIQDRKGKMNGWIGYV